MGSGATSADVSARYLRVTARMNATQQRIGAFVQLAVALTVVPGWRTAVVLGTAPLQGLFNALVSTRLLPRVGLVRGQLIRTVVNVTANVVVFHVIGWPGTTFVWLPFVALVSDGSRRDVAYAMLGVYSVAFSAVAIHDGVPWRIPLGFVAIALLCRWFTDARVDLAHELLAQSEAQRSELDASHERLKREMAARQRVEIELRQAQKLEAVGRLAAGIAHEINNPLQYVDNGAQCVVDAVRDLAARSDRWRSRLDGVDLPPGVRAALGAEEAEIKALRADIFESLGSLHEGVGRVTEIVRAMQDFAYPDRDEKAPVDLNRTIEATLVVSRPEYAPIAEIVTDLARLPAVSGHAGAIGQALACLVVNAAQAIGARGGRGTITVRSFVDGAEVGIAVTDDGTGIAPDIEDKVFEPFFTTRPVGSGSGQGLAIARSIVEGHGGRLGFVTEVGAGTTFTIRLPRPAALEIAA